MSFQHPVALAALAVVPLLVLLWVAWDRRRAARARAFTNLALLPNLVDRSPGRLRLVPPVLFVLALTALVVGFARPHANITVPRKEATVVLALDVSRSMQARDVTPTRDRLLVQQAIGDLSPGEGTAIGDAVALSAQLGKRQRTIDGVVPPESVLLLSDGAPDGGRTSVPAAIQQAKALHVPVSTVLLGTNHGVVTRKLTGGYTVQIRVPPSPGTLEQIARGTGGQFFRARSAASLDAVYRHLATRIGHRTESREVTDLFAVGALVLLLAGGVFSVLRFRRVP